MKAVNSSKNLALVTLALAVLAGFAVDAQADGWRSRRRVGRCAMRI